MQDQENQKPEEKPEPKPEPVKSSWTRLQETIDRAGGQAEARRRITEAIVNKRKKIAEEIEELKKKAEADQAANDAVPVVVPDMKAAPVHFLTPKDEHTGQVAICGALGSPSMPSARYNEETTDVLYLVTCQDCLKELAIRYLYICENPDQIPPAPPQEPEIPDIANSFLDELLKIRDQDVELRRAQVDVLRDIATSFEKIDTTLYSIFQNMPKS